MYSRTYDAQRFSPLKQINRQNVGAAERGLQDRVPSRTAGEHPARLPRRDVRRRPAERAPCGRRDDRRADLGAQAAVRGRRGSRPSRCTTTWSIGRRRTASSRRSTRRTGAVRWETKTDGGMTSGVIVVEGKVLSGRACSPVGANCYIAAHDAKTGKEAVAIPHRGAGQRSGRRLVGRLAGRGPHGGDVGSARRLRSAAPADPVGRGESDAEHAARAARRQSSMRFRRTRRPICTATPPWR